MYFTIKILKLLFRIVLFPFRPVWRLLERLVEAVTGRPAGGAGGTDRGGTERATDEHGSVATTSTESTEPASQSGGPDDEASRSTTASGTATTASGSAPLSVAQFASVFAFLAVVQGISVVGQVFGIWDLLYRTLELIRFLYATPIATVLIFEQGLQIGELPSHVAGICYASVYGYIAWRTRESTGTSRGGRERPEVCPVRSDGWSRCSSD